MPDTPIFDDGSPEGHNEKMLAMGKPKVDDTVTPKADDTVTPRPDNVPEKFWDSEKGVVNTEALLKAQADGEVILRQQQAPKETDEDKDKRIAAEAAAATAEADQSGAVTDAQAQWAEKGELTAETYASLDKAGLNKDTVDSYINGQKALIVNLQTAAYNPFEGKDGYDQAANWAAEVFTDSEIQALDVQLTSNNPAIVAQGAAALQARYAAEADVEPSTIRGDGNTQATGDAYASSREMMKDMNSREYRTSAAFRAKVAMKVGRSNL